MLEINPLVETPDGKLVAVDAKLSIDENALFRQPELAKFFDETQVPAAEVRAKAFDLAYVALVGNIGCMVNGAGLAWPPWTSSTITAANPPLSRCRR